MVLHSHPHSHPAPGFHVHDHEHSPQELKHGFLVHDHKHSSEELKHGFKGNDLKHISEEPKHELYYGKYNENQDLKSYDNHNTNDYLHQQNKHIEQDSIWKTRTRRTNRKEYLPRPYLQEVDQIPDFHSKTKDHFKPFHVPKVNRFENAVSVSQPRQQSFSKRHNNFEFHTTHSGNQYHPGSYQESAQSYYQPVHERQEIHRAGVSFSQKRPQPQTHHFKPLVEMQPSYYKGYVEQSTRPKKQTNISPPQFLTYQNAWNNLGGNQLQLPLLPPQPKLNHYKQPNHKLLLVMPKDQRIPISSWYDQHNQMLKNQPHRQDSVERGTPFEEDTHNTEDGVLDINAVWPRVLKNFNHEIIPLVREEQTNNPNGLSPSPSEQSKSNKKPTNQQFPQETRDEIAESKIYKGKEDSNITNKFSKGNEDSEITNEYDEKSQNATLKEDLKSSTEVLDNDEQLTTEINNDEDLVSRKSTNTEYLLLFYIRFYHIISTLSFSFFLNNMTFFAFIETLANPGEVQIMTENIAGQIALIGILE